MKKWLMVGLVLFGVCGLFGIVVGFFTGLGPYDIPPAARSLPREMERSDKLGLPMVQEELKRQVPKEKNAALVVGPLLEKKWSSSLSAAVSDYHKGVAGGEAAVRKLLAERKNDMNLVAATRLPDWEMERDYDRGPYVLFPEMAAMKDMARALSVRGAMAAKAGQVSAAITDLEASRRMANWMSQEPTLIGLLVGIAIDAIALRGYETAIYEWRRNPAALARLEASLAKTNMDMTLERSMRGEFYLALSTARNLKALGGLRAVSDPSGGDGPPPSWTPVRTGVPKGVLDRAFLASSLKLFNDMFEKYNKEGWSKQGVAAETAKMVDAELIKNKVSYLYAAIIFPVYQQSDTAIMRREITEELTMLMLKARITKARTGAWPKITAKDPFAHGDAYRAAEYGDTFRIWSVGGNGADEGGPVKSATKVDDIVVASPR